MKEYKMGKTILVCAISLSFILSSGCRFIVPSKKDSTALNEQGTFGSGAPAWATLPKDQQIRLPANSGVIPQTFTVPEAVSLSANANASSSVSADIGRGIEVNKQQLVNEQKLKLKNKQDAEKDVASDNSEIGKIEKECPGTENAVVDAIKTENTVSRIKKYLVLTKRCPTSSSVWLWLGKDYLSIGRANDARRCAEAALSIDPNNSDAKAFLSSLNLKSE
jgi:hypothetical protein